MNPGDHSHFSVHTVLGETPGNIAFPEELTATSTDPLTHAPILACSRISHPFMNLRRRTHSMRLKPGGCTAQRTRRREP